MSYYRPLPSSLTIKQSEINGLGLFATEDIPEKTLLGVTHVFNKDFENDFKKAGLLSFDINGITDFPIYFL